MPRISRLSVLVFLALSGLGAPAWLSAQPGGGRGPTPVTVTTIQPQAVASSVVANGSLLAREEVRVQPETSGRIVELNLEEGAVVEAGTLLVKLDDRALQAELASIQAERRLAETNFRRQEDLAGRNAVPQEALDSARSQLEQLEAQLELIRTRIDYTEIRAPFRGTLGLRQVSVGAYVGPGDTLTTLQTTERLRLDFSVPERYQGQIQPGLEVELAVRGFSETFRGTIYAMAPAIDRGTRSMTFRAEVPNPERKLLPGNFARVTVPLEDFPESLMVPGMAVLRDEGSAYVFVAEDGQAVRRTVTVGIRTRDEVQILDGLKAGDQVIVRGGMNLSDGGEIRIVDQGGDTERGS